MAAQTGGGNWLHALESGLEIDVAKMDAASRWPALASGVGALVDVGFRSRRARRGDGVGRSADQAQV